MKVDIGPYPYRSQGGRKVSIKIHQYDCWDAYATVAKILVPLINRVKADRHGYPCGLNANDPNDHTDDGDKLWGAILNKILWSMEELASDRPNKPKFFEDKSLTRKQQTKRIWAIFEKKVERTDLEIKKDDEWCETVEVYNKRVQEGCDLLGKYFQNLWT